MSKYSFQEARKAEQEADVILRSLSRASESAIATTLASIPARLEKNTPLMYHIHALLENEEWRAVLEASAKGVVDAAKSQIPEVKQKGRPLRVNVKTFGHLTR